MRAFIALTLPDTLRDRLVAVQSSLRRTEAKVNWVRREAMHLTIRFLGDIDDDQAAIMAAVVRAEQEHWNAPPRLAVGDLGAFPNKRNPRVIWVGVGASQGLTAMAERLEAAARDIGLEPETRPFSAHLTLGRVKFVSNHDPLLKRLRATHVETFYYDVPELTLIKSELSPQGPTYTALEKVTLG